MLALTCARAGLADGQDVLELGCGWGSLTLWMAEHYPSSRITAVSNSSGQRRFIEGQAAERGLTNIEVITADVNALQMDRTFDRIVSVEMLEHVKNHPALFARIATGDAARRWRSSRWRAPTTSGPPRRSRRRRAPTRARIARSRMGLGMS